jgi:predicted transcriptional regulator
MVPDNGNNGTELVMGRGSTTNKTEIPAWLEDAARGNIAQGRDVANLGPVPYYGPDVAAFTPMQQASFQNTGQAANAFGMAGGGLTGMEGMPQAQQFAGGVSGYSSAPMYEEALAQLEARNPGQFAAIQNMFINPQTGQGGYQPIMPMEQPAAPHFGGGGGGGGGNGYQSSGGGNNGGGSIGGYSSIGDMFDGGGPGASGDQYSGGGRVSALGNVITGNY